MRDIPFRNDYSELELIKALYVEKEKEFSETPTHINEFSQISRVAGVRLVRRTADSRPVVYVHLNDEPFYRAAIVVEYGEVRISSPYFNTRHISHRTRSRGIYELLGSSSDNTIVRGSSLKNLPLDVAGVIKKLCKQPPLEIVKFEQGLLINQQSIVSEMTQGDSIVTKAIEALVGRGYFSRATFDSELRVAAFLALEGVVRGNMPTFSDSIIDKFKNFLPEIDSAREAAAASIGKIPVQIVKLRGRDYAVKVGGDLVYWKTLPDAVLVPVATMMSIGSSKEALAGVGSIVVHDDSVVELDAVVMVDAKEKL